jgi:hypothetical protein
MAGGVDLGSFRTGADCYTGAKFGFYVALRCICFAPRRKGNAKSAKKTKGLGRDCAAVAGWAGMLHGVAWAGRRRVGRLRFAKLWLWGARTWADCYAGPKFGFYVALRCNCVAFGF